MPFWDRRQAGDAITLRIGARMPYRVLPDSFIPLHRTSLSIAAGWFILMGIWLGVSIVLAQRRGSTALLAQSVRQQL